jgi:hypothetical protein
VVLTGVSVCPSLSLVVVCPVVSPFLCDGSVLEVSEFRCVMVWGQGLCGLHGFIGGGGILYLLYGHRRGVNTHYFVIPFTKHPVFFHPTYSNDSSSFTYVYCACAAFS